MKLVYINTITIVILLFVIAGNIIYSVHTNIKNNNKIRYVYNEMSILKDDVMILKDNVKFKVNNAATSILDLEEFADLDPFVKEIYKKYIVNQIMPAIMDSLNSDMRKANVQQQFKTYSKEIDTMVNEIVKEIKTNGIQSIMQNMSIGSKPK